MPSAGHPRSPIHLPDPLRGLRELRGESARFFVIILACSPNYRWYCMTMWTDTKGKRWLELAMRIGWAGFHRALFEFHGRVRLCRTPIRFQGTRSRFHRGGSSASLRPSQDRTKPAISALLQHSKIGANRGKSALIGVNLGIEYCFHFAKSHDDRQLGKLRREKVSQNPSLSPLTCCARGVSMRWQKRHRTGPKIVRANNGEYR